MSITTVLESAEDQCRMPVTCGSTPASSAVAGDGSLSSSSSVAAGVSVTAGCAGVMAGTIAAVAGGSTCGGVTDAAERALAEFRLLAWAERGRWPRVHHTPAPNATAHNTTA